jgi:hypothetical protein
MRIVKQAWRDIGMKDKRNSEELWTKNGKEEFPSAPKISKLILGTDRRSTERQNARFFQSVCFLLSGGYI